MSAQRLEQLAVDGRPNPCRVIGSSRDDVLAVARELGGEHAATVTDEFVQGLIVCNVPNARGSVGEAGNNTLRVGVERGMQDALGMARKRGRVLCRSRRPIFAQLCGRCRQSAGDDRHANRRCCVDGAGARLPCNFRTARPSATFQIFTAPSQPAVANSRPSGGIGDAAIAPWGRKV